MSDPMTPTPDNEVTNLRNAIESIRDSVLHQRHQLADYEVDSDIINAVLGIIDDATPPESEPATPPSETPKGEDYDGCDGCSTGDCPHQDVSECITAQGKIIAEQEAEIANLESEIRTLRKGRGRVIETQWALIRPDGQIAGDGGESCTYLSRDEAQRQLTAKPPEHPIDWIGYLREVNCLRGSESFRVAKVITVEVEDECNEVESELDNWREREASVCPEDVGFVEYIKALSAELERVKGERDSMRRMLAIAYAHIQLHPDCVTDEQWSKFQTDCRRMWPANSDIRAALNTEKSNGK